MDEQTPPNNCNTLALLSALRFQNKNKGLIAFLCLLQKEKDVEEMRANQKPTLTEFINLIELLLICLSQTEDFD